MGKTKKYYNRMEMFLSSERGKRTLGVVYSVGASIVIIGALGKIQHYSWGGTVLTFAMITEALVFFISAFERPSNEYHWEEVFPVLESKNPLDRPDFNGNGGEGGSGAVIVGGNAANLGGGTVVIGDLSGAGGGQVANGSSVGGGVSYAQGGAQGQPQQSPQTIVNAGMATMGLNISEKDSETLAESIKKLNSAAEQISKMADLSEATQKYIEQISTVSKNLEKFSEITGSLSDVSDTLANSCKVISGSEDTEAPTKGYVEQMAQLNGNLSGLNEFYETQLSGLRSQMETIHQINAGLNRIRDLYDTSIVDSNAFRNENERMAQLLGQLNQVYSRLLQAMTVNMPGGAAGFPPQQPAYPPQQPPYQGGGYQQGGYR